MEKKEDINKISFREKLALHEKWMYLVYEICIYVCDLIFVLQLYFVINNFWGLVTTLACWMHADLYTVCIQTLLALIQLHRSYASLTERKFGSVVVIITIWEPFHLLSLKWGNKPEDILLIKYQTAFNLSLNVHLLHCLCFNRELLFTWKSV